MKRIQSNRFRLSFLKRPTWLAIPILIGTILQAETTFGQGAFGSAQKTFEDLLVSDTAIPDLVAISKTNTLKEDALKLLIKIKKDSLTNRLKQLNLSSDMLHKRIAQAEAEMAELHHVISEKLENSQKKSSSSFPVSRIAAEQLLIAAQLELQKIEWDLASESALMEETSKENEKGETEIAKLEHEIVAYEFQAMERELNNAQRDLQRIEALVKMGNVNSSEGAKAEQAVAKAENGLKIHQLRRKILEAQQDVKRDSQRAEMSSQIRKLKARKKQVESYISDLFNAMRELSSRDQLMARVDRIEKSIATMMELQSDQQTKKDETQGLVNLLEAIDRKE